IYDFGVTSDGQPFIAMDFLDGRALSEVIKNDGPLSPARGVPIFLQACDALAHAHRMGIIHRDLKPSNLMLIDNDGKKDFVKIVDFGIAKIIPQEGDKNLQLTATGEIFGSPLYMSPEQCLGQKLDQRSDIYQMGCLMYEAVAGKPPFKCDTAYETIH